MKNLGMILNNNKVFKKSNSKYFAWLDQDDYRDKNFLKECYNTLEANPDASLVFPNTGYIVYKKEDILMHINTIKSLANEDDISKKQKNLLNNFHDTIIYSLIRSSSLRNTSLWTNINGSANRLIFELVLDGKFEVNKLLSFYSGRGIKRIDLIQVLSFLDKVNMKKFYQLPFMILFFLN